MPATWQDWKREASLLDNQWCRFVSSRSPLANMSNAFFAPSSTHPNSSRFPAASYRHDPRPPAQPEPMELDRTNRGRKDPRCGLCFKCGKPGHIARDCRSSNPQRIRLAEPDKPLPKFSSEDAHTIVDTRRAGSSVPPSYDGEVGDDADHSGNEDF